MKRIILISLLSLPLMTFVWSQDCCEAEEIATNNCGGIGCYIPQCTESCEWEPMQCWSSTGYCWCVDEDGIEIDGTSMPSWQGYPDCEEHLEECDDGYTEYENECYYDDDLNTLTMLIYLNDIEFEVFYNIGITLWENGHINTLMLEGLSIHEIPDNIQNLDSLVHLSFSDNQLENIPEEIGNLPSLEFLFLSNNQLYELPDQIGNLNNLKFLHLPGNQLTELPTSISNLSNLQSLNVDDNLINSMPPDIIYLNSLQYLYIANNEIHQLPSDIGFLSELEILSAYTNNISVLPESIGNLFNLYHCDLTNNELIALPETLCNIYENLIVFNIGLNYICPPYPSCLDVDTLGVQDISSCDENSILGDLNNDETINVLDVVILIEHILNSAAVELDGADINNDGNINVIDVVLLVDLILNN